MHTVQSGAKSFYTEHTTNELSVTHVMKQKQQFSVQVAKEFVNLICSMHNGYLNNPKHDHQTWLFISTGKPSSLLLDTIMDKQHDLDLYSSRGVFSSTHQALCLEMLIWPFMCIFVFYSYWFLLLLLLQQSNFPTGIINYLIPSAERCCCFIPPLVRVPLWFKWRESKSLIMWLKIRLDID